MDKIKLEPAAALNMLWGKRAFEGEILDKFISHLDLSSGNELYEKCNSICEWYDEVILNRKYFIENYSYCYQNTFQRIIFRKNLPPAMKNI